MRRWVTNVVLCFTWLACSRPACAIFLSTEFDPQSQSITRDGELGSSNAYIFDSFKARATGNNTTVPIDHEISIELRFRPGSALQLPTGTTVIFGIRIGDLDANTGFGNAIFDYRSGSVLLDGDHLGQTTRPFYGYGAEGLESNQTRWIGFNPDYFGGLSDGTGNPPTLRRIVFTFNLGSPLGLLNDPPVRDRFVEVTADANVIVPLSQANNVAPLFSIVSVPLTGDYNNDGTVDAADYVVWRHSNGPAAKYNAWRAHVGDSTAAGGTMLDDTASVPEPSTILLAAIVPLLLFCRRRKSIRHNRV